MDTKDDLVYSSEADAVRFLYYQDLNDINLFVEDSGMEYEYETIFKRLLGDDYHIKAIFGLGGKSKVRERYKEFGSCTNGRQNFYIVDGDFDRYTCPSGMIHDSNFVYLEAYNIENYFIDENATLQFAKSYLKCMDDEVKNIVQFKKWKGKIILESQQLFLCYCFVQKFGFSEPTVARPEYLFIDSKTGFKRADNSFNDYVEHVLTLDKDAEGKLNEIIHDYERINGDDYFNLICGKFLLTSLYCYLRSLIKERIDKNDLRWALVNNFDVSKLDYVRNAILDITKKQ